MVEILKVFTFVQMQVTSFEFQIQNVGDKEGLQCKLVTNPSGNVIISGNSIYVILELSIGSIIIIANKLRSTIIILQVGEVYTACTISTVLYKGHAHTHDSLCIY